MIWPHSTTVIRTLHRVLLLSVAITMNVTTRAAEATGAAVANDHLWTAHVEPLLKDRCFECHNPSKAKSGLDLTTLQTILRGGDRGAAVIPGRAEDSNLYTFLRAEADPHMPPGNRKKLSDDEVAIIRQWIDKLAKVTTASGATSTVESATTSTPVRAKPRIEWRPPAEMPPSKVVDRFLELAWKLDRVTPAAASDDRAFVRRLSLDLNGRIPTVKETETFLRDRAKDKRSRLIEQLVTSPAYPRHMREIFDPVLMARRGPEWEDKRANQKWFDWLEDAFQQNRPWNEVVRDLIVARPGEPGERGAVWFLYERENNAQAVAEALAPVVFGLQVKCAQCHDHMIAREIKQAHYWGMVAAFNRSKNVDTPAGPRVAESAIGGFVSFANLKKESQPARLTFFNGRHVDEPWPKDGEKETDSPDLYVVPPAKAPESANANQGKEGQQRRRRDRTSRVEQAAVPKFSRREAFADATTHDNPLLARAMVNRIWAMLFGRGIVHPVDLMDSKHPPTQPELLDWLARDFERHDYDVKRLIRTLTNTRAYQFDSRTARANKSKPETTGPGAFSRGLDKPLSAEQLFQSLLVATENSPDTNGVVGGKSEKELRRAFVKQFPDLFPAEYNASLQQAMFFSNSALFDHLLAPRPGNLAARLAALPSPEARVREAFAAAFGRLPDAEEIRECTSYLQSRPAEAGVKQMLWALLTSAEFQVNH